MPKYAMTIEVEAEQFLPQKDQIPQGVISDGPRTPRTDPRAAWVLNTQEGTVYLKDGDWIVRSESGTVNRVSNETFEKMYKEVKEG